MIATPVYRELNGARTLSEYLTRERLREDQELLTEPLLADLMERLLGFPTDAYFPQLGRSGLKPDFTPHDLVAHRFVLDAKSSTQDLVASAVADPSALNDATCRRSAPTSNEDADHAVARDHHRREHGVARQRGGL